MTINQKQDIPEPKKGFYKINRSYNLYRKLLTKTTGDFCLTLFDYFSTEQGIKLGSKCYLNTDLSIELATFGKEKASRSAIEKTIQEIIKYQIFLINQSWQGREKTFTFYIVNEVNLELFKNVLEGKGNFYIISPKEIYKDNNIINLQNDVFQNKNTAFVKTQPAFQNTSTCFLKSNIGILKSNIPTQQSIDNTSILEVIHNPKEYYIKENLSKESINQEEKTSLIVSENLAKNDDDDFKKLELINEENNKMMDSEFKDFNNLLLRHNSVNEPKKEFSKYNFPINQPSDFNKSNLSNEKSNNDKIYVAENLTQNLTKQQRENAIYLESIGIKKDKTNNWLEIINLPFRLIEDEYIKILDMVDRGQPISNIASYTLKCLEKIAINQKSIDQEQLRVRGKDTSYYWTIFNIHSEMREKYPNYFREIQRYLAQSQSEIDLASDLFKKAEKILNNHSDSKELKVILQDFCNKVDNKNLFGAWLSGCIGCRGFNEDQMYYILELVR